MTGIRIRRCRRSDRRRALAPIGAAVVVLAWLLLAAGIAGAQNAAPPPPPPMGDAARAHYDRGLAAYGEKNYAAAIAELRAGFAVEPRREFLFAEAQAQRLAGDCRSAVPLYQRFLATAPPAVQVTAAQVGLARCAQQMATTPPLIAPPAAPLPAPPPPARPPAEAWYRDRIGGALLTAGVIGVAVGAGFLIAAAGAQNGATTYDDYNQRRATIEGRWNIGVVGLVAGAALAGAGTYRFQRLRAAGSTTTVNVAATPSFGGLLLEGHF